MQNRKIYSKWFFKFDIHFKKWTTNQHMLSKSKTFLKLSFALKWIDIDASNDKKRDFISYIFCIKILASFRTISIKRISTRFLVHINYIQFSFLRMISKMIFFWICLLPAIKYQKLANIVGLVNRILLNWLMKDHHWWSCWSEDSKKPFTKLSLRIHCNCAIFISECGIILVGCVSWKGVTSEASILYRLYTNSKFLCLGWVQICRWRFWPSRILHSENLRERMSK